MSFYNMSARTKRHNTIQSSLPRTNSNSIGGLFNNNLSAVKYSTSLLESNDTTSTSYENLPLSPLKKARKGKYKYVVVHLFVILVMLNNQLMNSVVYILLSNPIHFIQIILHHPHATVKTYQLQKSSRLYNLTLIVKILVKV